MTSTLTKYEQETIMNYFNKVEDVAYIFTYERIWQRHLEKKLGLKLVMDNGFGGRGYELPKKMIKPLRMPKELSSSAKGKLVERLHGNRVLSVENLVPVGKSDTKSKDKDRSMSRPKQGKDIKVLC